jgi:hypothetical protein
MLINVKFLTVRPQSNDITITHYVEMSNGNDLPEWITMYLNRGTSECEIIV